MQPTRQITTSPVRYIYLCPAGHMTKWIPGLLDPPKTCNCGAGPIALVWGGIVKPS